MDKKTVILIVLSLILLLGFSVRFYNIGSESIWTDEGYSLYFSSMSVEEMVDNLKYDNHPPLYYLLLKAWTTAFGDSETSIRFLSLIFSVITIFLVYRIGEEIYSKKTGLYASFLISIAVFHVKYAQEARSYTLFAMLAAVSFLYFFRLKKDVNKKNIVLYLLSSIFLLYTHTYSLFLLLVQNIVMFLQRKDLKKWLGLQTVLGVLYLPYIFVLVKQTLKTMSGSSWMKTPGLEQIYYNFFLQAGNYNMLITFLLLLGFFITIRYFANKDGKKKFLWDDLTLWLWWLLPVIIALIVSYTLHPVFQVKYFLPASIALYLLVGKAITSMKPRWIRAGLLILIIVFSFNILPWFYNHPYKEDWRSATQYIDSMMDEEDRVLFYPGFTEYMTYDYYSEENTTTYMVTYLTRELNHDDIVRMSPMFGEYEQILLVESNALHSQELIDAIENVYGTPYLEEFRGINIYVFTWNETEKNI